MFPSAMEPPISTIRSMFAPPVRSSSSAMLVSGPVGTSVTGRALSAMVRARKSTAPSASGPRLAGASAGPSRPLSPCTCEATVELPDQGLVGACGDRHVGAAGQVEHADGVRRRLVERLVPVHGRHAEELDLRARQGQQQRDRVVVSRVAVDDHRNAHARSIDASEVERTFRMAASPSPASRPQNAEPMPPKLAPDAVTRNVTTAASR